jgi:PhnB protein
MRAFRLRLASADRRSLAAGGQALNCDRQEQSWRLKARAENGRITRHLLVRGGRRAMEFYTRAFGATALYESAMPHGDGIHAHLQVGKTMIMITDEQSPSAKGLMLVAAPESLGGTTTILEMYVDDVDIVYQRAVAAGGKPMMPIGDAFYGDRTGWVADPFGLGDLDGQRRAGAGAGPRMHGRCLCG